MRRVLLLLPLLTGCGGTPPPPPPPEDRTLATQARAGRLALEAERPGDAARLYGAALARARVRDDAEAIADAGIGLAAADLERGDAAAALRTTQDVEAELARRHASVPATLRLAEALAQYRLGHAAAADAAARQVIADAGSDGDAALRAWFLRGLIAADAGDRDGLATARAALGEPTSRAFRGDALELAARAALLNGDSAAARRLAEEAAVLRRETLDYRGLARLLALQAEAERRDGAVSTAADLMLRAGRGAASRGDAVAARRWLGQAMVWGRQSHASDIVQAAQRALRDLDNAI
ncbi:hypothetical protein KPL78_14420 [Roseomonas sp. HJA6]|uniref:MalT-like TPR region domain-containing protein n=1 Tax=Roseomonas alba TaxID=2846776 RepID=A0ABS7A9T2_9PROT|nr:hypothetical protein [Neoroseomonas alba]MBW6399055.1 hypothetical protein [Neoroseomonas alba]